LLEIRDFANEGINMTRQGDRTALRHLSALNNKRNCCIHVHVYLFVREHAHLSIGLTVMHICIWAFRRHVKYL